MNRILVDESTNLTYYDGSNTFDILFGVAGVQTIFATLKHDGTPFIKNTTRIASQTKLYYGINIYWQLLI